MVDFYPTKNPFGLFEDLLLFVVAYLSVTPLKVRAAGLLARCQKEKNNCRKLEAAVQGSINLGSSGTPVL
jgi:hypothetical protein